MNKVLEKAREMKEAIGLQDLYLNKNTPANKAIDKNNYFSVGSPNSK